MLYKKLFKVGLFNPGSLGNHHDELIISVIDHSVDILAINETWLRANEEGKAPSIPGYTLRSIPRPTHVCRGRGGGVAFYIKKGIYARTCNHPVSAQVEQMWLSLNINGLKTIVGTAYRPPWLGVDVFFDALTDSINSFYYDNLILLGDFNIDFLNLNTTNTKKLINFINIVNLKQVVNSPTHFTEHSETLIDVICTDARVQAVSTDVIGSKLTKHALVTCDLNFKKIVIPPIRFNYRPLSNIDIVQFNSDLYKLPLECIGNCDDVNDMVTYFTYLIKSIFDIHAPLKSIVIKHRSPPWITETVKLMCQLKNEAHKRYLNTKKPTHHEYFKELKKLVSSAIDKEKRAYFDHNINKCIKRPVTLWKSLKRDVLPPKPENELPVHLQSAEEINKHFLNLPGIVNLDLSVLTFYEFHRANSSSFSLKTVDMTSISRVIAGLKSNAEGVDMISLDMLLLTLPYTLEAIASIVNTSITTSKFPDLWKTAVVQPLPKTPNPTNFKDLRPISILPCLSKVLEKVVCQQLTDYLESNDILPLAQSGFRKCRSTTTTLLDVTSNILEAQDAGMGTILVLLDFSRAFDSINVSLLLSKLAYYGFDPATVKWFDSYLHNRSQMVKIRKSDGSEIFSDSASVTRGVPQGSILGPLLFIIYGADIVDCIKHCKYHLYADDLQMYLSCKPDSIPHAVEKINEDLTKIFQWSNRNSLKLNPDKSKFMIIGSKYQILKFNSHEPMIKINGETILRTLVARNLGLTIDEELKFETYLMDVARNCFYRLKLLYRIRNYLSIELRIKLVESLILSKFNYADSVYGPRLLARSKNLIQRVQNACARFCYNIPPRSHVSPYINRGKLLNMASRRYIHFATLLFGIITTRKPPYLFQKLNWSSRMRLGRLQLRGHKTTAFKGSFKYAAVKIWNNIPPPIRSSSPVTTFRRKIKEYVFNCQIEGVSDMFI